MGLQEFIQNFADALEDTDVSKLSPQKKIRDIDEWDSLAAMSIMSLTKLKYDKILTASELGKCSTIEDLYNLINSK